MTLLIIILLGWPLVVVPIFNYIDYRTTKDGGKPNYLWYFIIRGVAAILYGVPMLMAGYDKFVDYSFLTGRQLLMIAIPIFLYQATSFWIVYEIIRNAWTHRKLLYYDHSEHDSGWLDRFSAYIGPVGHAFLKLIALVLCVLCFIKMVSVYGI